MVGTCIMVGMGTGMGRICTSPHPSPHPIKKFKNFSYLYPYSVNVEISCQNGGRFGQYPHEQVYLPSLLIGKGS